MRPDRAPRPDRATPAWSHTLTVLGGSPYWRGAGRRHCNVNPRRDFILRAAHDYADYDEMPPAMRRIFDAAWRALFPARAPYVSGTDLYDTDLHDMGV